MSQLLASIHSIDELLERIPDAEQRLKAFYEYLKSSERMLLALIADLRAGNPPGSVEADAEGDLEFGLFLYWLGHPDETFESLVEGDTAFATGLTAVRHFAPTSAIAVGDFEFFKATAYDIGVVGADGTLWTPGKYANLDPGWLTAGVNYAINLLDPKSVYHPYPEPSQAYRAAIGEGREGVSVAIIGDWGCGPYGDEFGGHGPAVAVMKAVKGLNPDYVVHLGDVYYCGTDDRLPAHEERDNLLAPWDSGAAAAGSNFTLNSNHEMYGAAQGLINVALAGGTPFAHQNKAPYFALEYGDWVLVGLDSAYFDPSHLYMKGALGNADNTQQRRFVESLGDLSAKRVMVMTHHNPMSYDGETIVQNPQAGVSLWDGMDQLLGRRPDLWYWGHLHLGVAYNANSVLGKTGTVCRCVGHSAIPFGDASGMNTANVDYFAHTPVTEGAKQVRNGFAVVTLSRDGSFREEFYEVTETGACAAVWSSPQQ